MALSTGEGVAGKMKDYAAFHECNVLKIHYMLSKIVFFLVSSDLCTARFRSFKDSLLVCKHFWRCLACIFTFGCVNLWYMQQMV